TVGLATRGTRIAASEESVMARQFDRHFVLRGLTEESLEIEREIADIARRLDYSEDKIARTRIALKEAIANAWVHGNQRDCSKSVFVDYTVDDREIRIRVADEGP